MIHDRFNFTRLFRDTLTSILTESKDGNRGVVYGIFVKGKYEAVELALNASRYLGGTFEFVRRSRDHLICGNGAFKNVCFY